MSGQTKRDQYGQEAHHTEVVKAAQFVRAVCSCGWVGPAFEGSRADAEDDAAEHTRLLAGTS